MRSRSATMRRSPTWNRGCARSPTTVAPGSCSPRFATEPRRGTATRPIARPPSWVWALRRSAARSDRPGSGAPRQISLHQAIEIEASQREVGLLLEHVAQRLLGLLLVAAVAHRQRLGILHGGLGLE